MRAHLLLLALLPLRIAAQQRPTYITTQDSIDFARFMQRPDTIVPRALQQEYRLVWHEQHYPGFWSVVRGDGRTLAEFTAKPPIAFHPFEGIPHSLGGGRVVIASDPPMGLFRINRWYFEAPSP